MSKKSLLSLIGEFLGHKIAVCTNLMNEAHNHEKNMMNLRIITGCDDKKAYRLYLKILKSGMSFKFVEDFYCRYGKFPNEVEK